MKEKDFGSIERNRKEEEITESKNPESSSHREKAYP